MQCHMLGEGLIKDHWTQCHVLDTVPMMSTISAEATDKHADAAPDKHATPQDSRTATWFPKPLAIHLAGSPNQHVSLLTQDVLPAWHPNTKTTLQPLVISLKHSTPTFYISLHAFEVKRGGSTANHSAKALYTSLGTSPSSTSPPIGYAGWPLPLTAAMAQERSASALRSSSHWLTCCSRLSVFTSALHGPATAHPHTGK